MSLITVIFIIWVAYSLIRGYQKGLWVGLLDVLAFLCAYVGSYIWGGLVNAALGWQGWQALGGYLLVYGGIYLCVGIIPKLFVGRLLQSLGRQALPGAGLGLVTGVVSGLVGIWAYQFFMATAGVQGDASAQHAVAQETSSVLETTAYKLMGEASRVGATLTGADSLEAELAGKFAEQPAQMLTNLQQLGDSPELQRFLSSPHIQMAMRNNNMDALIESPEFQALVVLPALAEMRDLAVIEVQKQASLNQDVSARDADYFIASHITQIWQKTNNLRSDPEIQALLEDPQVRELLENKDLAGLMTNSKARDLLRRLMAGSSDTSVPDTSDGNGAYQAAPEPAPTEELREPAQIYQWRDEDGVMRYSDQPPPE